MTVDTRDLYPDMMAEEDFQILVAIAKSLTEKVAYFYINLPGGVYLSNHPQDGKAFAWAGVDSISEAHNKLMDIDATVSHVLVMPTKKFEKRIKIGKMFGMTIWADPECPDGQFGIMREEDYQKMT